MTLPATVTKWVQIGSPDRALREKLAELECKFRRLEQEVLLTYAERDHLRKALLEILNTTELDRLHAMAEAALYGPVSHD